MANRIFISYRHSDAEGANAADRLADDLRAHFGDASIFYDEESLPPGVNWRDHVRERLPRCHIVVAVIGSGWGDLTGAEDPIRFEFELARQRKLAILPVLVRGASMPGADAFPEGLKDLKDVIAVSIGGRGDSYRQAVKQLIDSIETMCTPENGAKTANSRAYADTFEAFLTNDGVIDATEASSLQTFAEATHLTPQDVEEIEAEVTARVEGQSRAKTRRRRALSLALIPLLGIAAVIAYAYTRPEFPARYTVRTGNDSWMNSEPRGCQAPFERAWGAASAAVAEGTDVRGTFDEPACRNYCWMDGDTEIEVYERSGRWLLVRVVEGHCDSPERNKVAQEAHDKWNHRRAEPDSWECCAAGETGFVWSEGRFERHTLSWLNPPADRPWPLEPDWCLREPLTVNERTLCETSKLWGIEARQDALYRRLHSRLSDRPAAREQLQDEEERWRARREACEADSSCTEAALRRRIHALERHGRVTASFEGFCKRQAPANSCGPCNTDADCGGMPGSCWAERSKACESAAQPSAD